MIIITHIFVYKEYSIILTTSLINKNNLTLSVYYNFTKNTTEYKTQTSDSIIFTATAFHQLFLPLDDYISSFRQNIFYEKDNLSHFSIYP